MEPLAFVMAILGCGEGDLPCAELRQAPSRFESQSACLAATEEEIGRHTDLDYPVIVAQCRRAGSAVARVSLRAVRTRRRSRARALSGASPR